MNVRILRGLPSPSWCIPYPRAARLLRTGAWALPPRPPSGEGTSAGAAKLALVPDLAALLLRKSLESVTDAGDRCGQCERSPLPGERLHEMDSGRILCDLCLAALPEEEQRAVSSQRIHASERRLAVVPKAA
jgi:hypothetical protein